MHKMKCGMPLFAKIIKYQLLVQYLAFNVLLSMLTVGISETHK